MKITLEITPEQALVFLNAMDNTKKGLQVAEGIAAAYEAKYMEQVYHERAEAVEKVAAPVEQAVNDWQRIQDEGKRELPDYPTPSSDDLEELDCMFGAIEARAQDARRHIAIYGEGDESRLKAAAGCLHVMKWHLVEVGMWFYGCQCANISERKGGEA